MTHKTKPPHWVRPCIDGAMTLVLLIQMVPGAVGNPVHEVCGLAFVALFVAHHALNRGWLKRLGHQRTLRARMTLVSDVVLTACVLGSAVTGVLMSRFAVPWLSIARMAHVVRPLHGTCAYVAFLVCALHVGLHVPVLRGYVGLRVGGPSGTKVVPWLLAACSVVGGAWAFVRLNMAGKLLGQPSFPDGITPLWMQLGLHLLLAAPFVVAGMMLSTRKNH